MSVQKYFFTWDDLIKWTHTYLKKQLEFLEKDKTCIISIGRGGMVPSCLLSHLLKIEYIQYLGIKNHEYSDYKDSNNLEIFQEIDWNFFVNHKEIRNIVLVDDLIDSGKTLKRCIKIIKDSSPTSKIYFCCFFNKSHLTKKDLEIEKLICCQNLLDKPWVVFPYEK